MKAFILAATRPPGYRSSQVFSGRRRGRTPVTTISPKVPDHRLDLVQRVRCGLLVPVFRRLGTAAFRAGGTGTGVGRPWCCDRGRPTVACQLNAYCSRIEIYFAIPSQSGNSPSAVGSSRASSRGDRPSERTRVYKGSARALTDEQVAQAREWVAVGVPKAEIAGRLKVGRTTLYGYLGKLN